MKKILQLLLIFSASISTFGQANNELFLPADSEAAERIDLDLSDGYTLLETNDVYWNRLLEVHPKELNLTIAFRGETLSLEMTQVNLVHNNLKIRTNSGSDLNYKRASNSVFYQGHFEGYENSHFALSILNNEIIGVGSIPGIGDVNLGKLENDPQYIFFTEAALDHGNPFACGTVDDYEDEMWVEGFTPDGGGPARAFGDCVGVYFEIDEDIYLDKGGVIEAADYVTALFNEIALIYAADGIDVYISDIFVWDVESPYDGIGSTLALLELFGETTEVWTGDIGHFLSYRGGGGIAWVDVICEADQYYRKAVSDINSTFAEVPVYSWSVEVVTHEMGHNLGSPHTHACFWNGDLTAIDGCGPDAGYSEGCDAPLPPSGTVMSYCHLVGGVGIDLALGMGDQPAELIQDIILAADCLGPCPWDIVFDAASNSADILSLTCEGDLIESSLIIMNNGDYDLVSLDIFISIDGVLEETIAWTGSLVTGATETVDIADFTLDAGIHTLSVEVANPNGVEDMVVDNDVFEIEFEVTAYPVLEIAAFSDISCFGEIDGMIDVAITGGTPDFIYSWDNGAGTEEDASGLGENIYTLTVTDAAGCIVEISQEITEPSELLSTATVLEHPLCFGDLTGIGEVDVTGGIPDYDYSWTSGGTEATETGLGAGSYTVTVLDANGCITEQTIELIEPDQIVISGTTTIETFGGDGAIDVTVVGGVPGYTYSWNNGAETEDISDLDAGTYTLTVTDANGCTMEYEFVVGSELSIEDLLNGGFDLYPNPASTTVYITNHNQVEILSLALYNSLGQLVYVDGKSTNSNYTLDVSEMAKGVYYIVLNTEGQSQSLKLIIE